ncbi:MAG: ABC transporter substrate-binding protein [Verrucomicrobia bacterium]|nr:ABC transporter substrate-binding protein [Verrucomicrobiota bacterium]
MSTALTGPAQDLGRDMRLGVEAALSEVNRQGGIQGQTLELIALDDGYEPARAVPNMRKLIDLHEVVAIIGNVGTPTAVASMPIAIESETPFYGAFTGAGVLRKNPPDRYVINFRASYAEETAAMVDGLIQHLGMKPDEIAFFTQRDAYGDAGFSGGVQALHRHRLTNDLDIAHVRYERNTVAVEKALANLIEHEPPPKAVIMVGAYAPCAAFIRLAREYKLDALFLNVSFVGPTSLARSLGAAGEGVIVTQVVPHFESDLPIVREYQAAIRARDSNAAPSFGSLEGYVATRIFCRALATISGTPTRRSVLESLENLGTFDIGLGVPLRLTREEHQACHRVWPTVLRAGNFVPFKWEEFSNQLTRSE